MGIRKLQPAAAADRENDRAPTADEAAAFADELRAKHQRKQEARDANRRASKDLVRAEGKI